MARRAAPHPPPVPTARDTRLAAAEARYVPAVRVALLRSVERALVAHAHGASPALAASFVSSAEIVAALRPLYLAVGGAEALRQYAALLPLRQKKLGSPPAASGWLRRLHDFITTEGAAAVRGITATTRALVQRVLADAANAGLGAQAAATALREKVTALAPMRALRIVRTELVSASNYGSLLGAEATGLKLEKVWLATPGPRTRPDHQAASGQGAQLQGGWFTVGGYRARYPGDVLLPAGERINCRCSLTYREPPASGDVGG